MRMMAIVACRAKTNLMSVALRISNEWLIHRPQARSACRVFVTPVCRFDSIRAFDVRDRCNDEWEVIRLCASNKREKSGEENANRFPRSIIPLRPNQQRKRFFVHDIDVFYAWLCSGWWKKNNNVNLQSIRLDCSCANLSRLDLFNNDSTRAKRNVANRNSFDLRHELDDVDWFDGISLRNDSIQSDDDFDICYWQDCNEIRLMKIEQHRRCLWTSFGLDSNRHVV